MAFLAFLGAIFAGLERLRRRAADATDRALAVGLGATLIALLINAQFHNTAEDNALWAVCGIAIGMGLWTTSQPSAARTAATTSEMSFSSKSGANGSESVRSEISEATGKSSRRSP